MHASLQRNLLDYVRKLVREGEGRGEKLQFFIATHSTTIVNEASVKELHIMAFPKQSPNGNQLLKVTADEDKLYLIRDLLGDIGYLASGKPILLLEGKEDVEILKLLKPDVEEKFTLLPFGGKGKILSFSEIFERVVPELISVIAAIIGVLSHKRKVGTSKQQFEKSKALRLGYVLAAIECYLDARKGNTRPIDVQMEEVLDQLCNSIEIGARHKGSSESKKF
ncbi:hypothetical protein M1M86_02265 [Dehalococcoidales bacterium]|nr:hypothetical protein [Dehalococcoidales bacterium]